jgi:hypothetical protein
LHESLQLIIAAGDSRQKFKPSDTLPAWRLSSDFCDVVIASRRAK